MSNPQDPGLRRSEHTEATQDSWVERAGATPGSEGSSGPVNEENRPGHHPETEQDKPDPDAFAEKLGTRRHDDGG